MDVQWKNKGLKGLPNPAATTLIQSCTGRGFGNFILTPPPTSLQGWLAANSWFQSGSLAKGANPNPTLSTTPTNAEVAEYTSLSKTIHYLDAWRYFGTAIQNLFTKRYRQAIHFAYYGSLHASMSILASAGIGVWDRRHPLLDDSGHVAYIAGVGTHEFAWHALSLWMDVNTNTEHVMEQLLIDRISIAAIIAEMGGGSSASLFGRWFGVWSSDLATWVNDRTLRNESSYRPSLMKSDEVIAEKDLDAFVRQIWLSLQPIGSNKFGSIDSTLLFLTLNHVRDNLTLEPNDIAQRLFKAAEKLGISEEQAKLLISSYEDEVKNPNPIFLHASDVHRAVEDPYSALSIISRSLFLVRVAAAVSRANPSGASLDAWALQKSVQYGFVQDPSDLGSLDDLWQDILVSLEEMREENLSNSRPVASSRYQLLSEFERAALWTLAS